MSLITKEEAFKKVILSHLSIQDGSAVKYRGLLPLLYQANSTVLTEEHKQHLQHLYEVTMQEALASAEIVSEHTGDASIDGYFDFMEENYSAIVEYILTPEGRQAVLSAIESTTPAEEFAILTESYTAYRRFVRRCFDVETQLDVLKCLRDLLTSPPTPEKQLEVFKGMTLIGLKLMEKLSENPEETAKDLMDSKEFILSLSV